MLEVFDDFWWANDGGLLTETANSRVEHIADLHFCRNGEVIVIGGREGSTLSHSDKVGRVSLLRRKTSQLRPKGTRTPDLLRVNNLAVVRLRLFRHSRRSNQPKIAVFNTFSYPATQFCTTHVNSCALQCRSVLHSIDQCYLKVNSVRQCK